MVTEWKSIDNPPKKNKIVWVYDKKAIFDTAKQRSLWYRKQEGFPKGITHWRDIMEEPNE